MILRRWAEELCGGSALGPDVPRIIDLHIADTATAFFAACRTQEATALARFFAGRKAEAGAASIAAAAAAITRHSECDNIHMASCITPGSCVVQVALAFGKDSDPQRIDRAILAGYATGLRLGLALGGTEALGSGVWPTFFAAPLMAAATACVCLGLDADKTASALSLAATGINGCVGRSSGLPSGRWLAFGEAVARGCRAAEAAAAGFHGDQELVSAKWLAALAPGIAIRPEALTAATPEELVRAVGFKPFVAARQTINAVHAFQTVLAREAIGPDAIERVEVGLPALNAAMSARPAAPGDRLGTIANMALQIALAALRPDLLYDVERQGIPDAEVAAFANRVSVVAEPELDALLPQSWAGRVRVRAGSREFVEACTTLPGDNAETAEPIIAGKLARMVPAEHRSICAEQMNAGDGTARLNRREALWRAMLAAMPTPA